MPKKAYSKHYQKSKGLKKMNSDNFRFYFFLALGLGLGLATTKVTIKGKEDLKPVQKN